MPSLYRSSRGDLELFDQNPGPGWTLVATVSPAAAVDVSQLIQKQDKLADRERRQHGNLLKTRNALDELAGELDGYIATPERILAAVAKARRPMDLDPIEAPPQKPTATKLSPEEFLALFEVANRKRRGLE